MSDKTEIVAKRIHNILNGADLTPVEIFGILESVKMGLSHDIWEQGRDGN